MLTANKTLWLAVVLTTTSSLFTTLHAQEEEAAGPVSVKTLLKDDGTKVVTRNDPTEKISEVTTFNDKDVLLSRAVYSLDDARRATALQMFDGKGKLQFRSELTLDQFGTLSEEKRYNAAGTYLGRLVYGYDSKGRLRKIDAYDPAGNLVSDNSAQPKKKRPPLKNR